jgi:hypothetical protein
VRAATADVASHLFFVSHLVGCAPEVFVCSGNESSSRLSPDTLYHRA